MEYGKDDAESAAKAATERIRELDVAASLTAPSEFWNAATLVMDGQAVLQRYSSAIADGPDLAPRELARIEAIHGGLEAEIETWTNRLVDHVLTQGLTGFPNRAGYFILGQVLAGLRERYPESPSQREFSKILGSMGFDGPEGTQTPTGTPTPTGAPTVVSYGRVAQLERPPKNTKQRIDLVAHWAEVCGKRLRLEFTPDDESDPAPTALLRQAWAGLDTNQRRMLSLMLHSLNEGNPRGTSP